MRNKLMFDNILAIMLQQAEITEVKRKFKFWYWDTLILKCTQSLLNQYFY